MFSEYCTRERGGGLRERDGGREVAGFFLAFEKKGPATNGKLKM